MGDVQYVGPQPAPFDLDVPAEAFMRSLLTDARRWVMWLEEPTAEQRDEWLAQVDAALTEPESAWSPDGLNTERLARALVKVQGGAYASWLGRAELLAAEYAALTAIRETGETE